MICAVVAVLLDAMRQRSINIHILQLIQCGTEIFGCRQAFGNQIKKQLWSIGALTLWFSDFLPHSLTRSLLRYSFKVRALWANLILKVFIACCLLECHKLFAWDLNVSCCCCMYSWLLLLILFIRYLHTNTLTSCKKREREKNFYLFINYLSICKLFICAPFHASGHA